MKHSIKCKIQQLEADKEYTGEIIRSPFGDYENYTFRLVPITSLLDIIIKQELDPIKCKLISDIERIYEVKLESYKFCKKEMKAILLNIFINGENVKKYFKLLEY